MARLMARGEVLAVPVTDDEYPTFRVTKSGLKDCRTGDISKYADTHYIGCENADATKNTYVAAWK